jgi:Protein of unknown function (DUF3558)
MRPARDPAILLAAIVLAVAACGGGAATPAQTQSTAPTSAPTATEAAAETAAAGEPTEAPAAGGTFDACKLLSIDEVKSITGAATTADPEDTELADWVAGTCWWNSADMKVRFNIDYGDKASIAKSSSPTAQEQFDITKAVYQTMATTVEDLSGVGDKAFAWVGGAYAIKGDKAILVTAIFASKAEAIAILKAAVAKI